MNKICILMKAYLGYWGGRPHYGKARQITITTALTLEELRDALAKDYKIPVRKVGRPSVVK